MIEVFKTNVRDVSTAKRAEHVLAKSLGYTQVSFDLEDCDRVLRIEASTICNACVIYVMQTLECECEVLPG